jgi:hypothetical protein
MLCAESGEVMVILTIYLGFRENRFYLWMLFSPLVPRPHSLLEDIEMFLISHTVSSRQSSCSVSLVRPTCSASEELYPIAVKDDTLFVLRSSFRFKRGMSRRRIHRGRGVFHVHLQVMAPLLSMLTITTVQHR